MRKRLFVIFTALVLGLALLSSAALAEESEEPPAFSGGSGTEEDPYQIGSAADLTALAGAVNGGDSCEGVYFRLSGDIDFSAVESWTAIGAKLSPSSGVFSGVFDGGGHTISGIHGDVPENAAGAGYLFGYSAGTIKNLAISGTVTGGHGYSNGFGALCGDNSGVISGCVNDCAVIGSCLGGICGKNSGVITGCSNTGSITGSITGSASGSDLGGVCYSNSGTVTGCSNSAPVTCAGGSSAGIVCKNADSGTVSNCRNTGTISGDPSNAAANHYTGGICARSEGTIDACRNDGAIVSAGERTGNVGGVCGLCSGGTMSNCWNTGVITGCITSAQPKSGGICAYAINWAVLENCLTSGTISDYKDRKDWAVIGAFCGYSFGGQFENCYYLPETDGPGPVGEGGASGITAISEERLAAIEAAWLLRGTQPEPAWGWSGSGGLTLLWQDESARSVYRVRFLETENGEAVDRGTFYVLSGGVIDPLPALPAGTGGWATKNDAFTARTAVTADADVWPAVQAECLLQGGTEDDEPQTYRLTAQTDPGNQVRFTVDGADVGTVTADETGLAVLETSFRLTEAASGASLLEAGEPEAIGLTPGAHVIRAVVVDAGANAPSLAVTLADSQGQELCKSEAGSVLLLNFDVGCVKIVATYETSGKLIGVAMEETGRSAITDTENTRTRKVFYVGSLSAMKPIRALGSAGE